MDIKKIKLKDLISPDYNPRKKLSPDDAEYEKIKNSIEEFGYVEPIVVNKRNNNIIGGNQRYQVLKDLGHKEIDCILTDLDEKKEKALNVALNKISGEWDNDKLYKLLDELKGFDEDEFFKSGFDNSEFEELKKEFELKVEFSGDVKDDDFDEEKAIEEAKEEGQLTKPGDMYQIGDHYLLCGDSFKEEDRSKLIKDNIFDMMFTDPPYAMDRGGGRGILSSSTKNMKKRIKKLINFDVTKLSFLPDLNIGSFYIFTSKNGIRRYFEIFDEKVFKRYNILIWAKSNPTPFVNNNFLPDVEYIMYFAASDKRIWNNGLKPNEIYKKYYLSSKEEGRKSEEFKNVYKDGDLHPTMKPLELIINRIKISSKKNGKILDLFAGSGSTMIAATQLQRSCYMMEIEPLFCDVIIKRYIQFKNNDSSDVFLLNADKKIPWKDWIKIR